MCEHGENTTADIDRLYSPSATSKQHGNIKGHAVGSAKTEVLVGNDIPEWGFQFNLAYSVSPSPPGAHLVGMDRVLHEGEVDSALPKQLGENDGTQLGRQLRK